MEKYGTNIRGHLDIFAAHKGDEFDGEVAKSQEILIHGDPEGLRSFAEILIKIADTVQNEIIDLPIGARNHIHLKPGYGLSSSSYKVIIGRLDAKGTGLFYDRYISAKK